MTNTNMDKIVDKIQKLFALAGNNPSEKEAQAAALKAQKLIAQYNLNEAELNPTAEKISYEVVITSIKQHKFHNTLGNIIAQSFACRVILLDKRITFFGRSDNAKAAASTMEFVCKAMQRGGHKATRDAGLQPGHTGAASVYNSYVTGFIIALRQAFAEQTVALAVVVPQDVHDEFSKRWPQTRQVRKSCTQQGYSHNAFVAGQRDGATVLNKRALNA